MSEKDFAISVTAAPNVGHISKKPCYLITLEDSSGKTKNIVRFIAIDKPTFEVNFIQVKGLYVLLGEKEIVKRFVEIVAEHPKEDIVDVMFPAHRVHSIRSLVFNANKPSTLVR